MMISTLTMSFVMLALFCRLASSFDYYLIRHGARAPLMTDLVKIFGVPKQQLTFPGRVESFYYGQELRIRHSGVQNIKVYSTDTQRTITTADYILKGWYGLEQSKFGPYNFTTHPAFRPPANISFQPQTLTKLIQDLEYQQKVEIAPFVYYLKHSSPKNKHLRSKTQLKLLKKYSPARVCRRIESVIPDFCTGFSKQGTAIVISDLYNCLKYPNITLRDTKNQPILASSFESSLKVTDESYLNEDFGPSQNNFPYLIRTFSLLSNTYNSKQHDLVFDVNHDTTIFSLIRLFKGHKGFQKYFETHGGHVQVPFLTSVHFRIEDGSVAIFLNDEQLYPEGCTINPGNIPDRCTETQFFALINNLIKPHPQ